MQEYELVEPFESEVIDKSEEEKYYQALYQITTVITLVKDPIRNIRIVTQEELDNFLEGYQEYAEYIVDITKL